MKQKLWILRINLQQNVLSQIYSPAETNGTCIKSFCQATGGFARFPPPFPTDLVCRWLNHLEQRQLTSKTLQGVLKEIFKEANQTQVPVRLEFLKGNRNHLTLQKHRKTPLSTQLIEVWCSSVLKCRTEQRNIKSLSIQPPLCMIVPFPASRRSCPYELRPF